MIGTEKAVSDIRATLAQYNKPLKHKKAEKKQERKELYIYIHIPCAFAKLQIHCSNIKYSSVHAPPRRHSEPTTGGKRSCGQLLLRFLDLLLNSLILYQNDSHKKNNDPDKTGQGYKHIAICNPGNAMASLN